MSEFTQAMNMLSKKFSTAIIQYPTGKFGIAGSVPIELTRDQIHLGHVNKVSKVWNSEQEVIDALLGIGIKHFQKIDCSFYDEN